MKIKILLVIGFVLSLVMATSCHIIGDECRLPHYTNQSPRLAMCFSEDTLQMTQLANIYMGLVDGDTIIVQGYWKNVNYVYFDRQGYHYTGYIYDTASFEASSWNIQFLKEGRLWLNAICGFDDSIANGAKVTIKGILRFDFFGPGVDGNGPERCAETSCLELLELIKEKEG